MTNWGGFKNHFRTIGLACLISDLLFAGLGLSQNFAIYLEIMFFAGIPMPLFNVPTTTILQETVAQDMQGRVFGVMQKSMTMVMPIGMMVFGPLADFVSVESLLIFTGVIISIPRLIIFRNRQLNSAESDAGMVPGD